MPQAKLEETLDGVVEDCVNAVGVDVNTASPALLQRVSGLNKTTAKNIVAYREENGAFTSRKGLTKAVSYTHLDVYKRQVYVIPNDIELTMEYINHYYNENARAELVQELASKLGIDIYRIVA